MVVTVGSTGNQQHQGRIASDSAKLLHYSCPSHWLTVIQLHIVESVGEQIHVSVHAHAHKHKHTLTHKLPTHA